MSMTDGRKRRIDIGPRLTERDKAALCWIAEQYFIRADHLRVLLARLGPAEARHEESRVSEPTMRTHLGRWRALGLVSYRKIAVDQPTWIWLTPAGLREFGLEFTALVPTHHTLNHVHACNQVRLFLERRYPDGHWISERYKRPVATPLAGGKELRIVDAVFALKGEEIAVEVEMSKKEQARLDRSVALAAEVYTTVWYFCATAPIQAAVTQAVNALPVDLIQRVKVYPLSVAT